MKLRTPEQLAALPSARLFRRADAVARVFTGTRSDNAARRAGCRLSVISKAVGIQATGGKS